MSFHTFLLQLTAFSFCFYQVQSTSKEDLLVHTKIGIIKGVRASDGDYSKFLGIPYAKVQSSNHFGASIPYPPFEDVFLAQNDSSICPQRSSGSSIGDIDCLHLNVYVPSSASSTNKLPVMVFIHGGGFIVGDKRASVYGPKFLVRHDVIVVAINYRLGIYGFMCLDDARAPGNQGLKDQRLALRWVKENIEAFGGDAEDITICGESVGAGSVDLHTLTNQESLFKKAIMQSGSSLSTWTSVKAEPDRKAAFKIAQALDFDGGNTEETLSYLSSINSHDVLAKTEELFGVGFSFYPCVENKFENVEIFIDTDPINMKGEKAKDIPVLIGTNEDELDFYYQQDMKDVGDIFLQRLNESFYFNGEQLKTLANMVREFYIGDEEITNEVRSGVVDFESDFIFHDPIQRSIETYLKNGRKTFYYIFSYIGNRNFVRVRDGLTGGATHGDELGYLFEKDVLSEPDEVDQIMIDRMTTLWTNFIKFGEPTPETSDLLPNKWTPVPEGRMEYLTLDSEVQMKSRPFRERMAFLNLFYHSYAKFQKGYKESV